jgi:hypothetical protein
MTSNLRGNCTFKCSNSAAAVLANFEPLETFTR